MKNTIQKNKIQRLEEMRRKKLCKKSLAALVKFLPSIDHSFNPNGLPFIPYKLPFLNPNSFQARREGMGCL